MKGRKLLLPPVTAAAVSIAGCGVSVAQEDTSGEATTAEGGSSEGGRPQQISETNSPVVGTSYVTRSSRSTGMSL